MDLGLFWVPLKVSQNSTMVCFLVCMREVWGTEEEGLRLVEWGFEWQYICVCTKRTKSSLFLEKLKITYSVHS